ncbi:hypothetical protein [Streptomyces sp. NPDC127190]|uniref:hypothetical protein n=1 Tax=unclassified Streptomyces TaxID=2593676 RepID=UPI0036443B07
MTDNPFALAPEQWQRLASARQAYTDIVSPYYDETLQHVAQRACVSGHIGKADIGALLMWKRLRSCCRTDLVGRRFECDEDR